MAAKTRVRNPILNNLKCLYTNATSLNDKLSELQVLCETIAPAIVGITETWFKSTSIVKINGFCTYRCDRSSKGDDRRGGGVAIYVSEDLVSYELNDVCFNMSIYEQVWVVVVVNKIKYLIGCIYRPPDRLNMSDLKLVFEAANSYVERGEFKELIIMGDFNFPNINWSENGVDSIAVGNHLSVEHSFTEIINDLFLYQHVNFSTFQISLESMGSILDLIFTSNQNSISELTVNPILGNTSKGHVTLLFKFEINEPCKKDAKNKFKFVYEKGDYDNMGRDFDNIDWCWCLDGGTTQEMFDLFIDKVSTVCNNWVPKINTELRSGKVAFWINQDLKNLIRKKQNLRYKNCAIKWKDPILKNDYRVCSKLVKVECYKARKNYESRLAKDAKTNPKLLYRYINSQSAVSTDIKALRASDGSITNCPNEIVNLLNQHFHDVFVIEDNMNIPKFERLIGDLSIDINEDDIDYQAVVDLLEDMEADKSPGADMLSSCLLKKCARQLALPLTIILENLYALAVYQSNGDQQIFQLYLRKVIKWFLEIIDQSP